MVKGPFVVTQQTKAMLDVGGSTMCLRLFVGRRSASVNSSSDARQPAALARWIVAVSPVGTLPLLGIRRRTDASHFTCLAPTAPGALLFDAAEAGIAKLHKLQTEVLSNAS